MTLSGELGIPAGTPIRVPELRVLDGIALKRELFQADGIHPTAEAQKILVENVWPVLKRVIEKKVAAVPADVRTLHRDRSDGEVHRIEADRPRGAEGRHREMGGGLEALRLEIDPSDELEVVEIEGTVGRPMRLLRLGGGKQK
ncbi:MAG: hypothetical protein HC813_00330 [Planctomycetes bacterium]|nr:hypothetical protein [Planctomycetota bacterium]